MPDETQSPAVHGDTIQVGDIIGSRGPIAIGRDAQATLNLFISSDDALGPERERLLELLSSLPLSRPPVVESTPSSQRRPGEAAEALNRSQVFVMLVDRDINGFLEAEHARAQAAGIPDRLYLVRLPQGAAIDPVLADYLGGKQVSFHGPDDLAEQARPGLVEMLKDHLSRVDLEALLKWAMLYGLGKGVLDLLRHAIETRTPAASSERPVAGEESGTPAQSAPATLPAQPRQPPSVPVPTPPMRTAAGGPTVATPQNIRSILALPDPPRRIWWEKAGLELCLVPAGEFSMGTREDEIPALIREFGSDQSWYGRERPQHPVYLSTYYIGRYPVTQSQYARFVQATGHDVPYRDENWAKPYNWDRTLRTPPPGKEDHPVNLVRWADALAFCRWAGLMLPSEAEWEKAASWSPPALQTSPPLAGGIEGGRKRRYPWGNDWDASRCNTAEGKKGGTTPVGSYSPRGDSPYGCADMAGNVWEWTRSIRKPYPYDPADGRESVDAQVSRVLRGGSWDVTSGDARCASRDGNHPDYWGDNSGFRVSVSLAGSGS